MACFEWLSCLGRFAIPLLYITIGLVLVTIVADTLILMRHWSWPGKWVRFFGILICLYMVVFYGLKLAGQSSYDPAGLVQGIIAVDGLLLIAIWHRLFELFEW